MIKKLLTSLGIFLSLVAPASARQIQFVQKNIFSTASTISAYRLEGLDDSKGSKTLTNNGTVTFTAGQFFNAANFGASNSTKNLHRGSDNYGISGGSISMIGWVDITTQPASGSFFNIFEHSSTVSDVEEFYGYQNNAGTLRLYVGRTKRGVLEQSFQFNTTLATSTWHQVAFTYDGTTVTGYLDGSSIGTVAASGNGSVAPESGFCIGADFAGGSAVNFFSGLIDDTEIINRALSATEISNLFTSRSLELNGISR